MTYALDKSSTSALNAAVWVFALVAVLLLMVFALTGLLALRHRRKRKRAVTYLDNPERLADDPSGLLDNLTVGDLIGDPHLRQAVLQKRSELAGNVATEDASDTHPASPSRPGSPAADA